MRRVLNDDFAPAAHGLHINFGAQPIRSGVLEHCACRDDRAEVHADLLAPIVDIELAKLVQMEPRRQPHLQLATALEAQRVLGERCRGHRKHKRDFLFRAQAQRRKLLVRIRIGERVKPHVLTLSIHASRLGASLALEEVRPRRSAEYKVLAGACMYDGRA